VPLLNVFTSVAPPRAAAQAALLRRLSGVVARGVGKPERWVMIALEPRAQISFAGSSAPACYAELKNVGRLGRRKIAALSETLCEELARGLRIPKDRIYVEFTNADGALWGWDGGTFG
jgi:phenylpyruvate tautomerase PptA (4-oxalocrotonate tautomerase family)